MSLMPSISVTHLTPGWLSTSRSKRASALAPAPSRSTRLPPIPMFATPMFAVCFVGRQARRQQGRPAVIGLLGGARAVGDGIAEGHQDRGVGGRHHVDAGQPVIRLRDHGFGNLRLRGHVAFLRNVGVMQRGGVGGGGPVSPGK